MSEKLDRNVDQLELKLEELESDQAADEVVDPLSDSRILPNQKDEYPQRHSGAKEEPPTRLDADRSASHKPNRRLLP